MQLTIEKKCQCDTQNYSCPFHEDSYTVYLFGSWNNWSKGLKAKEITKKSYPTPECVEDGCCDLIYKYYYQVKLPKDLIYKNFEYKWQFINNETNEIIWLINTNSPIIYNEGWNENNLYCGE